jgi:hypothetical protein
MQSNKNFPALLVGMYNSVQLFTKELGRFELGVVVPTCSPSYSRG